MKLYNHPLRKASNKKGSLYYQPCTVDRDILENWHAFALFDTKRGNHKSCLFCGTRGMQLGIPFSTPKNTEPQEEKSCRKLEANGFENHLRNDWIIQPLSKDVSFLCRNGCF